MLGTIVNSLAIVLGGAVGLLLRGGLPDGWKKTMMHALGLSTLLIGIMGAIKTKNILLLIVSMVLGSAIGEAVGIEDKLARFGVRMERKLHAQEGGVAKGFVTATLIVCVGSMAIVGSLESGLTGNHETLFAKSLLDGVLGIVLASTFGGGVLLSAGSVFVYQGAITLCAQLLRPFLTDVLIADVSTVGSLLIVAVGLNILELTGDKPIRVGNMLPAILVPVAYWGVRALLGMG